MTLRKKKQPRGGTTIRDADYGVPCSFLRLCLDESRGSRDRAELPPTAGCLRSSGERGLTFQDEHFLVMADTSNERVVLFL